jgi:hypothetical protein
MSGLFLLRRSRMIPTSNDVTMHCVDDPIGAASGLWKSRVTQCGNPHDTAHRGPFATALSNFCHLVDKLPVALNESNSAKNEGQNNKPECLHVGLLNADG